MRKHKQRWIKKAYRRLCAYLKPETPTHFKNLREWAQLMACGDCSYYDAKETPADAVWEEIQLGL